MDKMLEALVEELAKRVVAKIGEDTSNMREFLKLKVKVEDIEGLDHVLEDKITDAIDNLKGECVSAAEDAAKDMIDSIEIECSVTGR